MSGLAAGSIERWRPSDSSRSVSWRAARDSAWASIRAIVVSTERSSGENVTGCAKPAIHAPMVRPATISGRKAQERRLSGRIRCQAAGNRPRYSSGEGR
jgi:hypothetical protein